MRSAKTSPRVSMKMLIEKEVLLEVGIFLEFLIIPVHRTMAFRVLLEKIPQPLRKRGRHLPNIHFGLISHLHLQRIAINVF